ncbi:hypothetical protein [Actinophytocola glycyrrhizae]|uniref:WD40 repeat protein n=1 Tax=Actinophytocola glycyrrhizae TaxID=2044873 RepID=A0ABV9S9Y5_9PSEU
MRRKLTATALVLLAVAVAVVGWRVLDRPAECAPGNPCGPAWTYRIEDFQPGGGDYAVTVARGTVGLVGRPVNTQADVDGRRAAVLVRVDTRDGREAGRIPLGLDYAGIAVAVVRSSAHDTIALYCPYPGHPDCVAGRPALDAGGASVIATADGRVVRDLAGPVGDVEELAASGFVPDTGDAAWQSRDDAVHLATAGWVVTFADDSVVVRDRLGTRLHTLTAEDDLRPRTDLDVGAVVTADRGRLAVVYTGHVRVWDLGAGTQLAALRHDGPGLPTFSADGRELVFATGAAKGDEWWADLTGYRVG